MQFSIIVPVYNVEDYLAQCIDAILEQDYKDYELILVDDGSTDASGAICDTYKTQWDGHDGVRIHVIHQTNKGLSGARNSGLDVAGGDWIVFIDSDDWVEPVLLSTLRESIETLPADLYSYNAYKTTEDGERIERLLYTPENRRILFYSDAQRLQWLYEEFLTYHVGWEAWRHVYRRSVIETQGLRYVDCSKIYAEDLLFTLEYILCIDSIEMLCPILYNYRQRGSSLLHQADLSTILPRIDALAEEAYLAARRIRPGVGRGFGWLYFAMINHQIQYTLEAWPDDEVLTHVQTVVGRANRRHRRWIREIRRYPARTRGYTWRVHWL